MSAACPRLVMMKSTRWAVRDGINRADAPFGYATSVTPDSRYTNLALRNPSSVYIDDASVLVHPDAAQR